MAAKLQLHLSYLRQNKNGLISKHKRSFIRSSIRIVGGFLECLFYRDLTVSVLLWSSCLSIFLFSNGFLTNKCPKRPKIDLYRTQYFCLNDYILENYSRPVSSTSFGIFLFCRTGVTSVPWKVDGNGEGVAVACSFRLSF